jgi:hypothetical protein
MRICQVGECMYRHLFKHMLHMSDNAAAAQSMAPLCSVERGTVSSDAPMMRQV